MKSIVTNLMLFSVIWCEHLILSESKVHIELEPAAPIYDSCEPSEMLVHVPRSRLGFEDVLQDPLLNEYLTSYFSKRFDFPNQSFPIQNITIVQHELITNWNGEYSSTYELSNGLLRAETGTFEETNNGTRFVVRGLYAFYTKVFVYRSSSDEFYMKTEFVRDREFFNRFRTKFLCSCCTRHNICSKMCGDMITEHELCPPSANPKTKLSVVKELTFNIYRNNSHEFKLSFENNVYSRAEFYDFFEGTSKDYIFGYFPNPDKPGQYLQYYYQSDIGQFNFDPERFPDLSPCRIILSSVAHGGGGVLPPLSPEEEKEISGGLLKTMIG